MVGKWIFEFNFEINKFSLYFARTEEKKRDKNKRVRATAQILPFRFGSNEFSFQSSIVIDYSETT